MNLMNPPKHIAIIMDGNRRYAQKMGMPKLKGHEVGLETFKKLVEAGRKMGLQAMTFYCFSTENWKRSKTEVSYLMKLLESAIKDYVDELRANQIQLVHLGRKDRLPRPLVALLQEASQQTKDGTKMKLNLAIDYGGRDELMRAFGKMQQQLPEDQWSESALEPFLDTAESPPLDIFIRTSGEYRLSNFLMWQSAYSELFFEDVFFPEFTPDHLADVIDRFYKRQRRYGT